MTQGKHTPGRLIVESCIDGNGFYVASEQIEYDAVCECSDWDNATRLAAAWNACEGIPTEALEDNAVADMLEALRVASEEIVSLESAHFSERAGPRDTFDAWLSDNEALSVIDAAIARATGEKP